MDFTSRGIGAALLAMVLLASGAVAQSSADWQAGQLHATRAELEQLLAQYEDASSARGFSESFRALQRDEADLIRHRLEQGDFQTGDQITLAVTGQQLLTNQFIVTPGPTLELPDIGNFSLKGLLRSELKQAVTEHIARYIRDPQVFVDTKMRLSVTGAIGQPGFHVVPAQSLVTDVIMMAGGPTGNAKQDEIRIRRSGDVIWDGEALQEAIVEGRTLDQLSLRAGDEIEIPGTVQRNWFQIIRSVGYLIPLGFAISRLF